MPPAFVAQIGAYLAALASTMADSDPAKQPIAFAGSLLPALHANAAGLIPPAAVADTLGHFTPTALAFLEQAVVHDLSVPATQYLGAPTVVPALPQSISAILADIANNVYAGPAAQQAQVTANVL